MRGHDVPAQTTASQHQGCPAISVPEGPDKGPGRSSAYQPASSVLVRPRNLAYRRRDSNPGLPSPVAKSDAKCALTSTNGADRRPETCTNVYRSGPKRHEVLHVCCTERWPDGAQTKLLSQLLASRQRASLTDVLAHGETGRLGVLSVSDPGCDRGYQPDG
jgi:hypothetical protein